jgi:hypothetical protein
MFSAVGDGGPEEVGRTNEAMMFGTLIPPTQRERTVQEILEEGRAALSRVPGRQIRLYNPAEMMRGGSQSGSFEVELQGNLPLEELAELSKRMIERLGGHGGFVDLTASLKLGLPELRVRPDREKAAALGVDGQTLAQAVQVMIGGMDVGIFKESGRRYDIRMRLDAEDRGDPSAIDRLYVRASDGTPIELGNLVHTEIGAAPSAITRTNRQRSVNIAGNLTDDLKLSEAVEVARGIADEILPQDVRLALAGNAEDMQESAEQFGLAIGLGILVIFMILAAQFESWIHPLTVMLALPGHGRRARGPVRALAAGHDRHDPQPLQHDRHRPAVRPGHEELDPAGRLRQPAAGRRDGQARGHAHRGAGTDAPRADDGPVHDLRRAAGRHRPGPGRRDAGAHGHRDRRGHALVHVPDAAGGAGLLRRARRPGGVGEAPGLARSRGKRGRLPLLTAAPEIRAKPRDKENPPKWHEKPSSSTASAPD